MNKFKTLLSTNQTVQFLIGAILVLTVFSYYALNKQWNSILNQAQTNHTFNEIYNLESDLSQSFLNNYLQYQDNLDPYNLILNQLEQQVDTLTQQLSIIEPLKPALQNIPQKFASLSGLVNQFKASLAVYNNSLNFIPVLSKKCEEEAPDYRTKVDPMLMHLHNPNQLHSLLKQAPLTPKMPENCRLLFQHLQIIAEKQQRFPLLAQQFHSHPLNVSLNRMDETFHAHLTTILKKGQFALSLLTLSIVFLLLYLWVLLMRLSLSNWQLQQSQQQLQKQKNFYHALSEINQLIVKSNSPEALLSETVQIIYQYTGITSSWMGKVMPDNTIRSLAIKGLGKEAIQKIQIRIDNQNPKTKVLASEVYQKGKRRIVQDYVKEKKHSPYYQIIVGYGIRSMAIYPIKEQNQIRYLLFLYSTELNFFDKETDRLIQELVEDIELAIEKHHLELAQQQAEEALKMAAIAFETHEAIAITDQNERIQRVNKAFEKLYGYSAEEIIGKTPRILKSSRHDKTFFKDLWQKLLQEGSWQGEIWNRTKSGEEVPVFQTITAMFDVNGTITDFVSHATDLSDLKSAEYQIRQLQNYDNLTELPNLVFLKEQLEYFRHQQDLHGILIMVNLQAFKKLNDALGRELGDQLLKEVAQRLQNVFKQPEIHQMCEMDVVSRMSGDEFAIFASVPNNLNKQKVTLQLITEIHRSLSAPVSLDAEHPYYAVHYNMGVTLIESQDDVSASDWLHQADIALHHAKEDPQKHIAFYQSEMQFEVEQKYRTENELQKALENEEFVMYYQPQVDLASGKVVGAETLIRWQKPNGELVPPFKFIPILEESALMIHVGRWIIKNVLHTVAAHTELAQQNIQVSINLSARQFQDPALVNHILSTLEESRLPAELMEFEVTESILMENIEHVKNELQSLQSKGIKIAIDDFGTGYSSFAYLQQFSVNKIKIDKSFIDELQADKNRAIVKAIIDMSQALGSTSIAEGVETQEQIETLMLLGCDEIQGYYYSKPLPFDEFLDFVRTQNAKSPSPETKD